jgi:hypothetical protein
MPRLNEYFLVIVTQERSGWQHGIASRHAGCPCGWPSWFHFVVEKTKEQETKTHS